MGIANPMRTDSTSVLSEAGMSLGLFVCMLRAGLYFRTFEILMAYVSLEKWNNVK